MMEKYDFVIAPAYVYVYISDRKRYISGNSDIIKYKKGYFPMMEKYDFVIAPAYVSV